MKYKEKLKNPKWQKKRLRIMERDSFTCACCASRKNTLNVHHLYYLSNTDPWDYPDEALLTLCEECHQREEKMMPVELIKLNMAIKNSCVPSWIVKILVNTFIPYIDKPEEAKRFIVDMNIESNKRNKTIDLDKLVNMANELKEANHSRV